MTTMITIQPISNHNIKCILHHDHKKTKRRTIGRPFNGYVDAFEVPLLFSARILWLQPSFWQRFCCRWSRRRENRRRRGPWRTPQTSSTNRRLPFSFVTFRPSARSRRRRARRSSSQCQSTSSPHSRNDLNTWTRTHTNTHTHTRIHTNADIIRTHKNSQAKWHARTHTETFTTSHKHTNAHIGLHIDILTNTHGTDTYLHIHARAFA